MIANDIAVAYLKNDQYQSAANYLEKALESNNYKKAKPGQVYSIPELITTFQIKGEIVS